MELGNAGAWYTCSGSLPDVELVLGFGGSIELELLLASIRGQIEQLVLGMV